MRDSKHYFTFFASPIGPLLLAGSDSLLEWVSSPTGKGARKPQALWQENPSAFTETTRQLRAWFAGERMDFDLPLAPPKDRFSAAMRQAMLMIPYGETATYGDLAKAIGVPVAESRAIGAACGANPLPIVVPCHRVVGAGGSLTGFGGGIAAKKFLLDHEFRRRPPKDTLFALM